MLTALQQILRLAFSFLLGFRSNVEVSSSFPLRWSKRDGLPFNENYETSTLRNSLKYVSIINQKAKPKQEAGSYLPESRPPTPTGDPASLRFQTLQPSFRRRSPAIRLLFDSQCPKGGRSRFPKKKVLEQMQLIKTRKGSPVWSSLVQQPPNLAALFSRHFWRWSCDW